MRRAHQQQVAEREYAYRYGMLTPNYPVPAIRLEVDICQIWHNTVAIFDKRSGHLVADWSKSNEYR